MSIENVARAVLLVFAVVGCTPEPLPLGRADYAQLGFPQACAPAARDGPAGATNDHATARKVRYAVRTPANYDATRAHPLLMVFAPAGFDRTASERYAKITTEATAAGFVVAYADHLPLGFRAFDALADIPADVVRRWCVDERRVTYAGHSDGGTTAMAITFLGTSRPRPAALAASAAGIRQQDLATYRCPAAVPALVIHSQDDSHFPPPAYGRGAADWWAACNRCTGASSPDADGCVTYNGCAAPTRFCATTGPHARWAFGPTLLLDFATAHAGQ